MKSNERAKWLNFSREDIYPEKTGKKKFVKHKNMHTPVFLAQQENFSNKKVELPSIKKKLILTNVWKKYITMPLRYTTALTIIFVKYFVQLFK